MFGLLLTLLLGYSDMSHAGLENENLVQGLPSGYKVDFQDRQGNMVITEMVPSSETVDNWSEMVTTQIFMGMKNATLDQFQSVMAKSWMAACKGGEAAPVSRGEENGYSFSIWVQSCPLNVSTGEPEITWFKAIRGNDSFYVVQKAFRFEPTKEQISQWMRYFRSVVVCDSRLASHPCPEFQKAGQ